MSLKRWGSLVLCILLLGVLSGCAAAEEETVTYRRESCSGARSMIFSASFPT